MGDGWDMVLFKEQILNAKDKTSKLKTLKSLIGRTEEEVIRIGNLVKELCDGGVPFLELAHEMGTCFNTVLRYYRVGDQALLPGIILRWGPPGIRKLSYCTTVEQAAYLDGKILDVVVWEGGQYQVAKKPVWELDGDQADGVFTAGHIRSVEEQVEYWEGRDTRRRERLKKGPRYSIRNGRIYFRESNWTKAELQALIKKM